jgi:hypothetical protein
MGQTIEVIVAFAGIMLGISLAITVLNQLVSNVFGMRGSALKWGLTTLLEQVHGVPMSTPVKRNDRTVTHAANIVDFVLTHPLVSDSSVPETIKRLQPWRRATAIEFETLQRVLQHTANNKLAGLDPAKAGEWSDEAARTWLSRNLVVTKEWFDAMMDRITQRFAMMMRMTTVVFALLLSFVFHINTFDLLHQLQQNPSAAGRINAQLDARIADLDPAKQNDELKRRVELLKSLQSELQGAQIAVYSENWQDLLPARLFLKGRIGELTLDFKGILGLLMTSALLGLGAPFWFNQLKNISSLRTVVAQKTAGAAANPSALPPVAPFSFTEIRRP